MADSIQQLTATCCITGGGPAGIMLGFLLARGGIDVVVLEKHADFFRDFRGDTIHPSTFQIMYELGLLDEFLKIPHQEMKQLRALYNNIEIQIADFSSLPVVKPVVGFMPQWDFLNFLTKQASGYPNFKLLMETEVTDVIRENGKVVGVKASAKDGMLEIRAHLTVGTDGRHSIVRDKTGLEVITTGAPIDVLWFRLSKQNGDPQLLLGRFEQGKIVVMIERDKYWQIGYIIDKGAYEVKKKNGIEAFKKELVAVAPFLNNRINELKTWDNIQLLSITIDHLKKWYVDGLLCIGDAAHAMSPVGGVGINLAVQDAVAAANILYQALRDKKVTTALLEQVQKRRSFPTAMTQRLQVFIQKGIVQHRNGKKQTKLPFFFRLLKRFPFLRAIPARLVGLGFRPEHIHTPDVGRN